MQNCYILTVNMRYLVVNVVVSLVTVVTLVLVLMACQRPLTVESRPPVPLNTSLAKAEAEANSVSAAVTTVQPESSTDSNALTTSYVETTTENSQTSETNGTLMQRNKIKEVNLHSCRVEKAKLSLDRKSVV